jgi:hypothetical protein
MEGSEPVRHNPRTVTALLVLAVCTAGLSREARAQLAVPAGVVASDRSPSAVVTGGLVERFDAAQVPPPRRSMRPFLVGGAVVGALVGGVLATSFNDSFCGEPAPGYSCSSTSPLAGTMIGAAVGVLAGWLVWALTNPTESSPPGSSR